MTKEKVVFEFLTVCSFSLSERRVLKRLAIKRGKPEDYVILREWLKKKIPQGKYLVLKRTNGNITDWVLRGN